MSKLSLRTKFASIDLWMLLGTAIIASVSTYLILANHSALEHGRLDRVREQMNASTGRIVRDLQSRMNDWGQWDEAYTFLVAGPEGWASENITADNLTSIDVDAMAIFDKNLTCRFGVMMRGDAPKYLEGGGEAFCRQIVPYLKKTGEIVTIENRIVMMPGHEPLVAAVAPIRHTDGSGPTIGYIAGATFIGTKLQGESAEPDLSISTLRLDRSADAAEFEEAKRLLAGAEQGVRHVSSTMTALYGRLQDDTGNDGLIIKELVPRDEYQAGLRDVWDMLAAFLALNVILWFVGITTTVRLIMRPLRQLAAKVNLVAAGNGESSSIEIASRDELGELALAVRSAVTKLEESRHEAEGLAYDLQKFRLAVENATDMIVITDADFAIIYASRASLNISGYDDSELVGRGALMFWSFQDETQRERLRQELEAGRPWHGEVDCRRKNGEHYVADLNVSPIMDKQGQLAFSVGLQRDITQAKEIDRMKTEFVSVASHQLKTPLTGIKWFTETLMQEDSGFTKEQREFMHQLYEMNERMIRLVNDLLNVSRIESGRKFSIAKALRDLEPVVQQAVTEQAVLAKKRNISISAEVAPGTLALMDQDKIGQVLHNLLNNAVKYSRDGGLIRLKVATTPTDVVVSVADDGLGIPVDQQKRIFEKFFRAANVGTIEGTGLGLYIVKAIIEGHGGQMSFISRENAGTTFTFTLPRQDGVPPPPPLPKS